MPLLSEIEYLQQNAELFERKIVSLRWFFESLTETKERKEEELKREEEYEWEEIKMLLKNIELCILKSKEKIRKLCFLFWKCCLCGPYNLMMELLV